MGKLRNRILLMETPVGALLKTLNAVRKRAEFKTDICDHLETLFFECLGLEPRLIVELGAGDGESTFVLERVAKLWNAKLVSVDIEDRKEVASYKNRHFIKMDDIEFARHFKDWCKENGIEPHIDILFIDTSHLYEHTLREVEAWFPFLSARSKAIFHDTNLRKVFIRKDGSRGKGWNNERGVIRAIENYFEQSFDEETDFIDYKKGWLIRHYTHCNGLMILDRYHE
jgi:cephalosporin hydroxylase